MTTPPDAMKALVYLGPRRMELQDVRRPRADAGEARVRVRAAAICGSDLHGFREASPRRIPPLVMGHEAVGVVDAVGAGVDRSLVGRRVVAMPVVSCGACARCLEDRPNVCPNRRLMGMNFPGAFAEAFTIPAKQLHPVPATLSDDVASLTEPLANAVHVVDRSVRETDDVLVIGAGPIGLFAARAAVLAGAKRVRVTDTVASRLELASALGAEPVVADEAAASFSDQVDVVIDAAGFPATWAAAVEAARYGGRIEVIGLGAAEGPLAYQGVVAKGLTITGAYACVPDDFGRAIHLLETSAADVSGWIATLPLADGQRAFEELVDGSDRVKVVLVP
jgi:2-desacetyl-2-hydroxyethyl bacteriochlorophyllide A dehydrogenase